MNFWKKAHEVMRKVTWFLGRGKKIRIGAKSLSLWVVVALAIFLTLTMIYDVVFA